MSLTWTAAPCGQVRCLPRNLLGGRQQRRPRQSPGRAGQQGQTATTYASPRSPGLGPDLLLAGRFRGHRPGSHDLQRTGPGASRPRRIRSRTSPPPLPARSPAWGRRRRSTARDSTRTTGIRRMGRTCGSAPGHSPTGFSTSSTRSTAVRELWVWNSNQADGALPRLRGQDRQDRVLHRRHQMDPTGQRAGVCPGPGPGRLRPQHDRQLRRGLGPVRQADDRQATGAAWRRRPA